MTDRIDYLCPMTNNLTYVLAVEKLLGLEIPPRAMWIRLMLNELTRINSHLVWLGTHALDIGAMTVFLYCFREREEILKMFEMVAGQRMMTSYFRVGGLAMDLPLGFLDYIKNFANYFPDRIEQYSDLLTNNPIWLGRTKGVALITKEDAIDLMLTGPTARGSGIDWDLRRDMPYGGYDQLEFKVPVATAGDVFARYEIRIEELRQSHQHGQAGHRESARWPDQGQRAEGRSSGSREDEDADGIAHLSLQDCHRRLYGSGGRGLSGRGITARRDGLLRGL